MIVPHALPPRHLKVSDLACRRGERVLFAGLHFAVGPGEILLLRGPNGVGKSTLLLALAGIFRPEIGTVAIDGRSDAESPGTDLHLLGHRSAVKGRLDVRENLKFWSLLNGGDPALIEPTLAAVGLVDLGHLDAAYLSAGQTRRLAIARLLVADRPIWLLDEPTAALDSDGELLVGTLIDAHLLRGGLVVAATHHDLPLHSQAVRRTLVLGSA